MSVKRLLGLALSGLLLAGCDRPEPPQPKAVPAPVAAKPAGPAPLVIKDESWKRTKPGCKGKDCAWIEAELQRTGDPVLESLLESELASLTSLGDGKAVRYDSLSALEQAFWPRTGAQWNIALGTRVLYQAGPLLTVELNNETYSGGAHGIGQTRYLVLDRAQGNRRLVLADMLVAGQDQAFWTLVREQHRAWLKAMDATDADFAQAWPFKTTDNIALTADGVVVKYQNYEIGPYAFGQPELKVPRAALAGVFKPEYLQ